ncbi:threonine/serine ThrE exporter family protein [Jonesia quinghaiensis]|uniref:threonine/serine ThrE exporter family protein n=1 Tax=Jonesia quinghaiensis TaxID=262806 RepID=UPI0004218CFE|nr:threonine/serine exporter family protein [Jonesia quinghaiensis]
MHSTPDEAHEQQPDEAVPPTASSASTHQATYAPTQPSAASTSRDVQDLLAEIQDLGDDLPSFKAKSRKRRPKAVNVEVVRPKGPRLPLGQLVSRLLKDPTATVPIERPEDKVDHILTMMRVLGLAMLDAGQATSDVQEELFAIAKAYAMPPVRVIVMPTVVIVQIEGTDRRIEIGSVQGRELRSDQAAAIDDLMTKARRGVMEPDAVIQAVSDIANSQPRFGWFVQLAGQIIMTLAIGFLINPSVAAIPAYLILGAIVGLLVQVGKRFSTIRSALPVIAAITVTVVASEFLTGFSQEVPLRLIAPALVPFLPGLTLTIAALELTRNEVISGASRLVYGIAQLMLLAFGVVIGLELAPGGSTSNAVVLNSIGPWVPLLGITLLALGYVLAMSAPEGAFLWIVLALTITWGMQRLGAFLVPAELSGFFGALIVVPLSRFLAQFRTAPPALVTQVVSFWILVPGSLGFISFTEAATGSNETMNILVSTGMAMFSIALGILVGSGLERNGGTLRQKRLSISSITRRAKGTKNTSPGGHS